MTTSLFVGIDLGCSKHWVTVLSPSGEKLLDREVVHEAEELKKLVDQLIGLAGGDVGRLKVAVELPRGAVVELFMERGVKVFYINPKKVDRFRDRHSVAGAKDDRFDAFVLAQSLMTDGNCFHQVVLDDAKVILLRELLTRRDSNVEKLGQAANQIRTQLFRYHQVMYELCPGANERWFWALWELVKRPSEKMPTVSKIRNVLKSHRIRRLDAEDIHERLKAAPMVVAPGVEDSAVEQIELLLKQARLLDDQIGYLEKRMDGVLEDIENSRPPDGPDNPSSDSSSPTKTLADDVKILRSFKGIGPVVLSNLICRAPQLLRDRNLQGLRIHGGLAPVRESSGKRSRVRMRYACSVELRDALHAMAKTNIQHDENSAAMYAAHRKREQSHGRSLRSVADRCLRIIMAMLRDGTTYRTAGDLVPG